jgi:hypothetical protein
VLRRASVANPKKLSITLYHHTEEALDLCVVKVLRSSSIRSA